MSAPTDHVAVVGAGTSALISELLDHGYGHVEAIDLAPAALDRLRGRLDDRADRVVMRVGDVRSLVFDQPVDVWHDRAVFHFLTDPGDVSRYVDRAATAVRRGGHVILATFAPDGPEQCSGLPVTRYDTPSLAAAFASGFRLVEQQRFAHHTPFDTTQPFVHVLLRRC